MQIITDTDTTGDGTCSLLGNRWPDDTENACVFERASNNGFFWMMTQACSEGKRWRGRHHLRRGLFMSMTCRKKMPVVASGACLKIDHSTHNK
ncbi:hypothetical protein SAMN05892877_114147 [Rhizobium subbaraonis]|uniref:Uncharacterized protein n=1 Tax=Rhizobium subbaraonis TaxID=908946 RepID=A0A285UU21_9HYPH|nr:hypothetical protein [Rhizobium subbaraonis]SOC45309.1 hypothetical protein SAMN05892877_114147 [Rhizobium subbaraonis]